MTRVPISWGLWGTIEAGHASFTPVQNATPIPPEQNTSVINYPLDQSLQPMELQEKQGKVCGGTSLHRVFPCTARHQHQQSQEVCAPTAQALSTQNLQRALLAPAPPSEAMGNDSFCQAWLLCTTSSFLTSLSTTEEK